MICVPRAESAVTPKGNTIWRPIFSKPELLQKTEKTIEPKYRRFRGSFAASFQRDSFSDAANKAEAVRP